MTIDDGKLSEKETMEEHINIKMEEFGDDDGFLGEDFSAKIGIPLVEGKKSAIIKDMDKNLKEERVEDLDNMIARTLIESQGQRLQDGNVP